MSKSSYSNKVIIVDEGQFSNFQGWYHSYNSSVRFLTTRPISLKTDQQIEMLCYLFRNRNKFNQKYFDRLNKDNEGNPICKVILDNREGMENRVFAFIINGLYFTFYEPIINK